MPGFEGEFADGDAAGGGEVDLVAGLDGPVGSGEEEVNFGAGRRADRPVQLLTGFASRLGLKNSTFAFTLCA